jgi:excisionase family DNA binding protein
MSILDDTEPLLTPAEVARLFRVDPKTVTRWAKGGKLTSIRTLGGHRRFRESEVHALLNAPADPVPVPDPAALAAKSRKSRKPAA